MTEIQNSQNPPVTQNPPVAPNFATNPPAAAPNVVQTPSNVVSAPPSVPPTTPVASEVNPNKSQFSPLLIIILLLIIVLAVGIFLVKTYFSAKQNQGILITPTPTIIASTPTVEPALGNPEIASPSASSKVTSPLIVKGKVPTGWMFEGQFPIKLADSNSKIIASSSAKEVTPGSWTSGKPVDFQASLVFTASSGSGFLILENDNPSGDPAKKKSFEVPVIF